MTEKQERLMDLVDAFQTVGNRTIETENQVRLLEAIFRTEYTADEIFEVFFGSIKELNQNLDECGYEGV